MRKRYNTLCLLLFIGLGLYAQTSTMWLMNGKKVEIKEYTLTDDEFEGALVHYTNANGKQKTKDVDDIFSVNSSSNGEDILYKKDINLGNEFTVDEMRSFLTGKTEIKKTYKGGWFTFGGVVSGIAGSVIPPVQLKRDGEEIGTLPVAPIIPVAYVIIAGNTTKTFKQLQRDNPDINKDDHYLMGCQKGIQEKRLKNSLIGSCIGIVAGIVTLTVIQQ